MQNLWGLGRRLASDSDSGLEPDRRARLVSAMLGVYVLLLIVASPIVWVAHYGSLGVLNQPLGRLSLLGILLCTADFGLSRTRYRSLAAPIFVVLLYASSFGAVILAPNEPALPAFIILATLASGLLLSFPATVGVFLASMAGLFFVSRLPVPVPGAHIFDTAIFLSVTGLLVLTMAAVRAYDGRYILRQRIRLGEELDERNKAEEALRLDSDILSRIPYGVVLVRAADGVIVHVNPQFQRMFGYETGELVGRHVSILNAPDPRPPEVTAEAIERAVAADGSWNGEVLTIRKDGTTFWSEVATSTFEHRHFGEVRVSVQQDITERRRVAEALESYQRKMQGLFQTALEINSQRDLSRLLEALVQRAAELLEAPMGSVYLMQADDITLELTVCHNMPAWLLGTRLERGQGLSGRVAETGEALMVPDYAHWQGKVDRFDGLGLQRVLGVPLKVKDRVIGVINIADDQSKEAFPWADIQLVNLFAEQAALAIENARLLDQTKHRAAELSVLYETTRDLSGLPSDLRGLLKSLVDRAIELLGATGGGIYLLEPGAQELVVVAATHPATPVGTRIKLGEGMAGRVAETRQPLIVDDYRTWAHRLPQYEGAPLTAVLQVPMLYGGDLIGVLAVEEERETTRRFAEADARLLSLFAAQAAAAVYSARLFQRLQQANTQLEQRVAARTAELEASNRRHEYLLSNSPAIIYTAAMQDGLPATYYSNNVLQQLGYSPEEMTGDPEFWEQRLHPDDRAQALDSLAHLPELGEAVLEYRFQNHAGQYVWLRDSVRLLPASSGQPRELIGSWIDISDRKEAERRLRSRLELEQAIAAISADFLRAEPAQAEDEIVKALRVLGELAHVDRSYVFLLDDDGVAVQKTYQWCAEGASSLGQLSMGRLTWSMERLRKFQTIRVEDVEQLPPEASHERETMRALQTRSLLIIPLGSAKSLLGWMGFDVLHKARRWLDDDVTILQVVGEMIANAYLRKQAHEQMALSLREKEALLREVHHRVKNNLQVISSLLNLGAQSREAGDPGDLLKSIHARVQAIALLHETLYRSGNMAQVDAAQYIRGLASMVFRFEQTHPGAVGLEIDTPHVSLNPETAVPLGLILTELVTNGLKHAFPDLHERSQKPAISISLKPRKDGRYDLVVTDNGIGLPPDYDRNRAGSMGLQLVYMLAEQLNGTVRAGPCPGGGSLFRITFGQLRYRERSLPYA